MSVTPRYDHHITLWSGKILKANEEKFKQVVAAFAKSHGARLGSPDVHCWCLIPLTTTKARYISVRLHPNFDVELMKIRKAFGVLLKRNKVVRRSNYGSYVAHMSNVRHEVDANLGLLRSFRSRVGNLALATIEDMDSSRSDYLDLTKVPK